MNKRLILSSLLVCAGGVALADEPGQPSYSELVAQVKALQAQVTQMQARESNYVSAAEVDATVRRVMADADKRSQVFDADSTLSVGYRDGRLLIQSADGNYLFHPYAQLQFRNITNYQQDATDDKDNWQNGFEYRRVRLGIDGNVFSKDLTYAFQVLFDRTTGNPFLEDAWAKYKFLPEWSVMVGQFKAPLSHENLVSSKFLLAMERSMVTDVFTATGDDYVQGVQLTWDNNDNMRVAGAFHDGSSTYPGINASNNNFQDFPNPNGSKFAANFGGTGRLEYKAFGDWRDYNDFSNLGLKKDLLVFGAAADYTQAGDTTVITETADVHYKTTNGWSFFGEVYADQVQDSPVSATNVVTHNTYNYGVVGQLGYLLAPKWEAYGRYGYIWFGQNSAFLGNNTQQNVQEVSLGVNYYIRGQSCKLTLDVTYLPDGSPLNDLSADILANDGGSEIVFGIQFQLLL